MQSNVYSRVPYAGETWEHTRTKRRYRVIGTTYNSITDRLDVLYEPLYPSDINRFNRQLFDHPKAWSSSNEDGQPRFCKVE